MIYTVPKDFPGTPEEKSVNYDTHTFDGIDSRCWRCDSRPGSVSGYWPCGTSVPRRTVTA